MFEFAANLSMLFTEVPFIERFALAKEAGFSFVEYMFPYDYKTSEIKQQLEKNSLKQILFNLPAGDWSKGDRGLGANPERVGEFRSGVSKAIEYALALGVTQLNCQAGKQLPNHSYQEQWDTLQNNVRFAAEALDKHKLRLVIEPCNRFDMPDFFLYRTEQVLQLLDELKLSNVFVQYDIYHAQREEGELTATLRKHLNKIGHIQIADNPGRHQPGTGEINYPFIFRELDKLGYTGYIGLEYKPSTDSKSSFDWIKKYGYAL
jgi:hydroxypyruvate isomerase